MESKIVGAPILSVILISLPTLQGSHPHCDKTRRVAGGMGLLGDTGNFPRTTITGERILGERKLSKERVIQ